MTTTPWNSIAESLVEPPPGLLDHTAARQSPCLSCSTSPCCTHLPLTTFKVTNLMELDHACYLLNFDHIELGIAANGDWSAYYSVPCRYLNRSNYHCSVHNTPTQPQICVHYNPYNCWYKRTLTQKATDEFVRLDRARLAALLPLIQFDERRQIVSVPAWETLVALMQQFDDRPRPPQLEPLTDDPALTAWERLVLDGALPDDLTGLTPPEVHGYDSFAQPCDRCAAYCCTTLVFPQSTPVHISNLDYYRFCLGFPGVELGVGDGGWSLIVKTTCRHLTDGRCAVYGQPDRPLLCTYYDAWKCTYKPQFGAPRPLSLMRIRLEQWRLLVESLHFDQYGNLLAAPSLAALRAEVEGRWQAHGRLDAIPLRVLA